MNQKKDCAVLKLNMRQNKPQDGLFYWTKHSQEKLRQYGLSASRVKRLIRHPERIEAGIAPETWASMQTAGSKKHPYEIWIMYVIVGQIPSVIASRHQAMKQSLKDRHGLRPRDDKSKQIRIISAWKYPGKTNPGDPIPIPPDIFEELIKELSIVKA